LHSKKNEGLLTAGIVNFAYAPLTALSPRASELRQEIEDRVRAKAHAGVYAPGREAQYEILLARLARDAPACELISVPGFTAGPLSQSLVLLIILGKAYLSSQMIKSTSASARPSVIHSREAAL
jgi:hypothetical protein